MEAIIFVILHICLATLGHSQFYLVHIFSHMMCLDPIEQKDPHMLTAIFVAVSHYTCISRLCMWQLLGS